MFNPRYHLDSENDHHLSIEPRRIGAVSILVMICAITIIGLVFAP